jgi:hypothetical protein
MLLGLGRDLEYFAGRLLSACQEAACCDQIAVELVFLPVVLMQWHRHREAPVLMLWRQRVLPKTDCWGQVVSEAQQVLAIP